MMVHLILRRERRSPPEGLGPDFVLAGPDDVANRLIRPRWMYDLSYSLPILTIIPENKVWRQYLEI